MCGSALSNGGGVVAVTRNYLEYKKWGNIEIEYVVTHVNGSAIKKILKFIQAYFYIINQLIRGKVDIFHLHVCDGGPFYRKSIILFTAKFFNKKVILHHHTDYSEFFASIYGVREKMVKKALQEADLNIVLGNNLVPVISNYEPEAKVEVVYNAVKQVGEYRYNEEVDTILFLGWILERKGVFDFLEAVKSIDAELPENTKVALCGFVDDAALKRIHNIGLDNRISHLGWIEGEKKEILLRQTIVNVLPSYREGLPMTVLETMALGIPNIVSNISTIPEVIQNAENGLLIEPGNIQEIADCIRKLVLDIDFRRKLSINSYNTIKNRFEVNSHIEEIKLIYNKLVKEH